MHNVCDGIISLIIFNLARNRQESYVHYTLTVSNKSTKLSNVLIH